MKSFSYRCNQCGKVDGCKDSYCEFIVHQNDPPAEDPWVCPYCYNTDDNRALFIPTYTDHKKGFYIICKGTLISSAYLTYDHAKDFIDENCLLNCEIIEL